MLFAAVVIKHITDVNSAKHFRIPGILERNVNRCAMKSLADLISALPAELYDQIYGLTSTAAPIGPTVDTTYKPPACLQVDRHSRRYTA